MNDSIHMTWLIENRVRLLRLHGRLEPEALLAYDRDTCALMDTIPYPFFHVIIDVRTLETFPSLNVSMSIQSVRHERMGWMITVGVTHNPLMRFFVSALAGATRIRYKDFPTIEAAVAFLQAHDQALPPISYDASLALDGLV